MRQRKPRQHDERHLDFLRGLPCCICGDNTSTEAAHIRTGNLMYGKEQTGGQQKPDDKWCLPVCSAHHREQHKVNEYQFWRKLGMNPFTLAMTLHDISGDHEMALMAIERHRGP